MNIQKMVFDLVGCDFSGSVEETQFDGLYVKYENGKRATMIYGKSMPFSIYMSNGEKELWKRADSPFFNNLIEDIVRFFGDGVTSFEDSRTKEVIKLCEMAIAAANKQETN